VSWVLTDAAGTGSRRNTAYPLLAIVGSVWVAAGSVPGIGGIPMRVVAAASGAMAASWYVTISSIVHGFTVAARSTAILSSPWSVALLLGCFVLAADRGRGQLR
jgi:hypothetical protein